ncbi:helix-turn-helix domain-containing protein [Streptomyces lonarensis]|uniref:Helix-turn-helix domain-containing protein n=1 Tax=Streptomyces lonarensis TaxID=700599 RepID=A0A7X6CXZ9_9ACTN|nr:helix-turn-helix transcriptional regulator [Streptomyces lonarensis]NJQ04535.1 helix-turn-helix domain-containing protein [Streptomyces lonarensis]
MTTPEDRRAFGRTVASLRKDRGLTQEELAAKVGRTASWVSQVERGAQPVNRLPVIRMLADSLGVATHDLRPDAPADESPAPVPAERSNDLDQARLLLSGHPIPDLLLRHPGLSAESTQQLRQEVDRVWDHAHNSRYIELGEGLADLLPKLERAARTSAEPHRSTAWSLLSQTYQVLAAAFVRQDQPDAAWVAADRAISSAERSGEPHHVFASVFRLVQAFVRLKHLDQAEHAATTAIRALVQAQEEVEPAPEELSLLGSLYLSLALVHARGGARHDAREAITQARQVAARLDGDRNDFNLEFGPTNVEVQAVSIAVELGDAGEAIDNGERIDAEALSAERQGRLSMDLGRAYAQRRQVGEALAAMLAAEEATPDLIHTHVAARNAIRELVLISGSKASPDLLQLAERSDAMP